MSKETIKAAIAAKIAGQGTQVDAGGGLAPILNDIIDEIPAPAPAQEQSDWNEADTESPAYIKNKPSIPSPYSLPIASAETLGGVKVGENLSIDPQTGVLSAQGGGGALIIEGTLENNAFEPNSGQPTKAQAITAFRSGKSVMISFEGALYLAIAISPDDAFKFYDNVFWD